LLLLAVAAVAVPAASAGGWATVGLSSLPGDTPAGGTWSVDLTVLQHGRAPLEGVDPRITLTNDRGESRSIAAVATGKRGVYHADVVFPTSGTWTYEIWDGFTQTHTFEPVAIAAPGGSFPYQPLALALVLAAGLAAATVLLLRRSRRGDSAPLANLKEAT
jgi:hypothetical protein